MTISNNNLAAQVFSSNPFLTGMASTQSDGLQSSRERRTDKYLGALANSIASSNPSLINTIGIDNAISMFTENDTIQQQASIYIKQLNAAGINTSDEREALLNATIAQNPNDSVGIALAGMAMMSAQRIRSSSNAQTRAIISQAQSASETSKDIQEIQARIQQAEKEASGGDDMGVGSGDE